MSKITYGVEKFEVADIDEATGLPTAFADIGKVYKDTASMQEDDPTITEHYSELNDDPELILKQKGNTTLKLSLMEFTISTFEEYFGGTVVVDAFTGTATWHKPRSMPNVEKAFRITTQEGSVLTLNRGYVMPKFILAPKRNEISLVELTIRVLNPKVTDVSPMTFQRPN